MNGNGQLGIRYPGIPTTSDGAGAVVWVEIHISQGAGAFPITSSTTMAHGFNTAVVNGQPNIWGDLLQFFEPESEHSSCTVCEGFVLAGGRVTNFTSGQGLILMKEVLYTISGKRLPVVYHIGSRALTSQSLNVHAGHDDVMGCEDVGWGMLFTRNAQGAGALALIARRTAEETSTPFFNIQDGFLTTHTVENVLLPEIELMKDFVGRPEDKLTNFFDPYNPVMTGVVQNQDSYMKGKIAQRVYYDKVMAVLKKNMAAYTALTGRRYEVVESYRMDDAEYAIVGMGSMIETAEVTIDWIRENLGIKVGAVHVTCFRPFPSVEIVEALKGVKAFSVGIDHELALPVDEDPDIRPAGGFSMRGHSVGGFGSVTTNKVIATIAGEVFGKEVQAYPKYGSEKKGLPTTYNLTVANGRIRTHSELNYVDFVPLNDVNAFRYGNPLKGLQPGGTVFIQTKKTTPEEVWANVPPDAKAKIREKNIHVMALDAAKIALEEAPKADLEVRMQGIVLLGIFLKAIPFDEEAGLSYDEVMTGVKKAVRKYFGNRGEVVVQANLQAIGRGYNEVFELPEACLASDITNPSLDPKADLVLFELDIL